jgi:putative oxidoreductase
MNRVRDDFALLFLRLTGLLLAAYHGFGKVSGLAAGETRFVDGVASLGFPAPFIMAWISALTEALGGILLTVGLGTRVAAAFIAFNMGVAAFGRHHGHQQILASLGLISVTPEQLEAWGRFESALIFMIVALALALTGAGRISLDHLFSRGKRS